MAASEWALKAATDRMRIAANHKASTRIKDVLKGSVTNAYLQHATIKASFKVQVLAEGQLGSVALNRNAR